MKLTYTFHTYVCTSCSAVSEEYLEKNEVKETLACTKCEGLRSLKNEPVSRRKIEQANVPINFIDQKADGSYRVTRIGRKQDIHND